MEIKHPEKLWTAAYLLLLILALEFKDADGSNCHMLIGGSNSTTRFMKSVELINVATLESKVDQEKLRFGVASHSGGVLGNTPVICGGIISDTEDTRKCFEYINGAWQDGNIPELTAQSYAAGKGIVDGNKLYIFGGAEVPLIKVLNYKSKSWENVSTIYDNGFSYGHCSVLVKRKVYFFGLGGKTDGTKVSTFNLDAPNDGLVSLGVTLHTNRYQSSCAYVNGYVYLVGGRSIGVEKFAVESKTSQVVSDFPDDYLLQAQLLEYNTDLLLIGGVYQYRTQNAIHKFSTTTNQWTKNNGTLKEERSSFVALSVDDALCDEPTTIPPTSDPTSASTSKPTFSTTASPEFTTTSSTTVPSTSKPTFSTTASPETTSSTTVPSTSEDFTESTTVQEPIESTTVQEPSESTISPETTTTDSLETTGSHNPTEATTTIPETPASEDCHFDGKWTSCESKTYGEKVKDYRSCHESCKADSSCEYFSFLKGLRTCNHYPSCQEKQDNNLLVKWLSARKDCLFL